MQQQFERRREEREKYLVLRLYARVVSGLSYTAAVVGPLFAVLVIAFGDMPVPLRISNAFLALVMGGVYFVILRATAQAIYLLFDVARNTKTSRELLEKAGAPGTAPSPPRPAPAVPQPKPAPGD
ncbi:MAG: hypothetical protein HY656_07530 [Acidobacteria bacterium]|nr:hypothetical protein [Acidobacteriota bacterium]